MVSQQLLTGLLTTAEVGGVNLPIWSSVRPTVGRLCIMDWEAGGTVWSVSNSGLTANLPMWFSLRLTEARLWIV